MMIITVDDNSDTMVNTQNYHQVGWMVVQLSDMALFYRDDLFPEGSARNVRGTSSFFLPLGDSVMRQSRLRENLVAVGAAVEENRDESYN